MRDFNPRPDVRLDTFEFASATNGGSLVPSRTRSPFNKAEEMELALELLRVTSEAELERFLGELFKKAWRGIEPVGSKIIGPLRVFLKTVAKKALPSVATAAGTSFGEPRDDAIAGNLGFLVSEALEAEVAGMTATDPDLEKCRQLLEKYLRFVRFAGKAAIAAASAPAEVAGMTATDRDLEKCRRLLEKYLRFVRFAGKAAMAAASAPAGVSPIVAAQRSLADSAIEKLARKAAPAGLTGNFAEGVPLTAAMKTTAAVGRAAGQKSRIGAKAPGGRICSVCELPPGSCQCRKIGRSGRWFRSGSSIIVDC